MRVTEMIQRLSMAITKAWKITCRSKWSANPVKIVDSFSATSKQNDQICGFKHVQTGTAPQFRPILPHCHYHHISSLHMFILLIHGETCSHSMTCLTDFNSCNSHIASPPRSPLASDLREIASPCALWRPGWRAPRVIGRKASRVWTTTRLLWGKNRISSWGWMLSWLGIS